jgi:hypothetical protein
MTTCVKPVINKLGVRIVVLDDERKLVRVNRKIYTLLLFGLLLVLFSPFVILLPLAFIQTAFSQPIAENEWLGLLCVGCLMTLFWTGVVAIVTLSSYGLYRGVFPRRFLVDTRSETCEFRSAPALGISFSFREVQAVTLSSRLDGIWRIGWLGLALVGEPRILLVQGIARPALFYPAAGKELESLANELAEMLHTHVEHRDNINAFSFQWR